MVSARNAPSSLAATAIEPPMPTKLAEAFLRKFRRFIICSFVVISSKVILLVTTKRELFTGGAATERMNLPSI